MIFHLWKYEWKRMFKRPVLFLFTLIFPIILLGLLTAFLYTVSSDELESVHILVLDHDQTFETRALIGQLQEDETIEGDVYFSQGNKDLSHYLEEPGEYAAIVQIPEGFTQQLRKGVNESINVYLNERLPLASNLAYLLMESGQDYISAAQTGVNTVNQFYIKTIEDSKERQQFLQQSIIHFTTFSLGRNSFFEEKSMTDQVLSWSMQLFIVLGTLLILFTYWLQLVLFQPKHQPIMQERLRLISVTRVDQLLAQWLYQVSFLICYSIGVVYLLSYFIFQSIDINLLLLIQWTSIAIGLSIVYLVIRMLIPNFLISILAFTLSSLILLILSGLIIPPIYLPEYMTKLAFAYEGFIKVWLNSEVPMNYWVGTALVSIVTVVSFIVFRKIGVMMK